MMYNPGAPSPQGKQGGLEDPSCPGSLLLHEGHLGGRENGGRVREGERCIWRWCLRRMWRLASERTGAKGPVSCKPQELPRGWGWTRGEVGRRPASRQGRGQRGSLPPSSDSNEVPLETWNPREQVPRWALGT